jgi:hypothetical protein
MAAETRADEVVRLMRRYASRFLGRRDQYDGCISAIVLAEMDEAPEPKRQKMGRLAIGFPELEIGPLVDQVAEFYRLNRLMPRTHVADSYHAALASVHRVDRLVSWNLKHLANPNKREHLRILNARLGLASPEICTPQEYLSAEEEE